MNRRIKVPIVRSRTEPLSYAEPQSGIGRFLGARATLNRDLLRYSAIDLALPFKLFVRELPLEACTN